MTDTKTVWMRAGERALDPLCAAFKRAGWDVIRRIERKDAPLDLDLYFAWGGNSYRNIEHVNKWRESGGKIIYVEWGWLTQRPGIYFDDKGLAHESTIMDIPTDEPLSDDEESYVDANLNHYKNSMAKLNVKYEGEIKPFDIEGDYILAPLQLECDSQIVQYSPIKTMQEFMDCFNGVQIPVYFKPHPRQLNMESSGIQHREIESHDTFYMLPYNCDLTPLIRNATAIVTINSCVGVEGIAWDKPVVTIGKSIYNRADLAVTCHHDYLNEYILDMSILRFIPQARHRWLFGLFRRQWQPHHFKCADVVERLTSGRFVHPL